MAMFMPNNKAVLAILIVATAHIGLLSLMIGQSPESINKPVQATVIQGILVAATPPPPPRAKPKPEPPRKAASKPEPKPLVQKVKTEDVPAVIEEPPEEIVEPVEESLPQEVELPLETEVEPIPEEPTQQPEAAPQIAQIAEVTPPRVDAFQHNNPSPRYPKLSKRLGEEGTVLLQLLINENGTVSEVEIKTSSGYPRLDKAAMKAVKQWRYTPASQGNDTIAYRYEQPVHFAMN